MKIPNKCHKCIVIIEKRRYAAVCWLWEYVQFHFLWAAVLRVMLRRREVWYSHFFYIAHFNKKDNTSKVLTEKKM